MTSVLLPSQPQTTCNIDDVSPIGITRAPALTRALDSAATITTQDASRSSALAKTFPSSLRPSHSALYGTPMNLLEGLLVAMLFLLGAIWKVWMLWKLVVRDRIYPRLSSSSPVSRPTSNACASASIGSKKLRKARPSALQLRRSVSIKLCAPVT